MTDELADALEQGRNLRYLKALRVAGFSLPEANNLIAAWYYWQSPGRLAPRGSDPTTAAERFCEAHKEAG